MAKGIFKILPIFLYALGEQPLSNENMEELRNLKETYPYNPILFVSALAHINFDSLDGDLSRSETRKFQTKIESSGSSSVKEDFMRSSSTQDDSFKSNSVRLDSVKESDDVDGLDLDKIDSLGMTWLDQLTDLGFMGENVEADQTTWLSNAQYSQSSDLLDSCKKLGILSFNMVKNYRLF